MWLSEINTAIMEKEKTFIEAHLRLEEEEVVYNQKKGSFFSNKIVQGIFLLVLFTAGVIPLIYWATHDIQDFGDEKDYICVIESSYRVPCGKVNITQEDCQQFECCYDDLALECFHAVPSRYSYRLGDRERYTPSLSKTPFDTSAVKELMISWKEDPEKFQVILHDASVNIPAIQSRQYTVKKYQEKLAVEVFRKSGERILTTAFGPLIASDDYWEWTIHLTTEYLFGLGQLHIDSNRTVSKVFYNNEDDQHTIPALMAYNHGLFHGVVIEHDGPLEVTILPSKLIMLKSLVGKQITLNLFPGPTPKDVMLQQRNYVFTQPPDWIYDAQICRGGKMSLSEAIEEYKKDTGSGIDYGIDCFHENLMMLLIMEQSPTVLADLKDLIDKLKLTRKFVMALTPHVPVGNYLLYNRAQELKVLYKSPTNGIYTGKYKSKNVAYLDFSSPDIDVWMGELIKLIETVDTNLGDGIALLDNWPAEEKYEMVDGALFSYINENITAAMSHTLPWNLKDSTSSKHMLTHNKYGYNHVKVIEKHIQDKPIITSAYHYRLNNPVVTRNVNTTWTGFKQTMITNLYHSFFAHPLIASPVCGHNHFQTPAEEHVCIQWYFMAASMPLFFARKDWPAGESDFGAAVAKDAIEKRKQLVHYYKHFIKNQEPISRPMFYDFHADTETFVLDEQYMIGDGLLACHPVYPTNSLRVYLPQSHDWYEFFGGVYHQGKGWMQMTIIETDWTVFIKSGVIVPLRIKESVQEAFSLVAALSCSDVCSSEGVLRYENAILTISINENVLKIVNILEVQSEIKCDSPTGPQVIRNIKIFSKNGAKIHDLNVDLCLQDDEYVKDLSTLV